MENCLREYPVLLEKINYGCFQEMDNVNPSLEASCKPIYDYFRRPSNQIPVTKSSYAEFFTQSN